MYHRFRNFSAIQFGEKFIFCFFICNLKCFSYFWSSTLIMEFWFQAWKCPFYAPLRFQTHNEIMIAVWPAAVIWHVYHSIKTPNTLKITFDSYSKYIEYNIQRCFLSFIKKSLMYLYNIHIMHVCTANGSSYMFSTNQAKLK